MNAARLRRWSFSLRALFLVIGVVGVVTALAGGLIRRLNEITERERLLHGQVYKYLVVPFDRPSPDPDWTGKRHYRRLGVTFAGGPLEGDLTSEQDKIVTQIRRAFPEAEVLVMRDLRGPWPE